MHDWHLQVERGSGSKIDVSKHTLRCLHVSHFQDQIKCRYDWHQTAPKVTLAIYGKRYDPSLSYVEVSPVRLKAHVVFPEQGGSFDLDLELNGVSHVIPIKWSLECWLE